ncbi:hypothetical protein IGI04_039582 [Brassica rapa subsp. trilocularis]|uniref:Band 7 domain-containing protein n=1 Tax=Brassica rapa subsp. trilocularis TaxID=1813537 RepID=A0ABQ7KLU8_BRACM|nr:hypothetical protein IGI04_039582 [Brassica rapa subsp. trilocularis]
MNQIIHSRSVATTALRSISYLRQSSALFHSLPGATATTTPIVNPHLASYGVENPIYAVMQLAQTTMRSELGKITLDKTFEERDTLNEKIVEAINVAAKDWGLECLRYEIRDIMPPNGVRVAMEMQAEAERRKRAQILESEGERQAHINIADGKKSSVILESEAAKINQVNRASGEAEAIIARAQATARGLTMLSQSLNETGGVEAASMRIAEQYIQAFGNIAKEGTTMLLPSSAANPANMIAQALTMYKSLVPNGGIQERSEKEFICWLHSSSHCNLYSFQTDSFFFNTMGGCASKPKESDILETSATTENVVVESKNVESEAVSQEKADEVVAEKTDESTVDGAETQKEAEPAKPAETEVAKPVEAEAAKPAEAEPAAEDVKTEETKEAAVEAVEEKASGETEAPKQEEAAPANDTKTTEQPLVTL